MKKAPLMTRFSGDVEPNNALPEYPRPQFVREKWMNLNGIWEFDKNDSKVEPKVLTGKILVPFPIQSALSGVMEPAERAWYRRTFDVPSEWKGERILLNFGAVDWECEVFVNGSSLGVHRGGYDPFSFDITNHLKPSGPQEVAVRVFDPTEKGGQPRGKQATQGIPILYTPSTGIWQTVWLEPVPAEAIKDLRIVPDIDSNSVSVTARSAEPSGEWEVKVKVIEGAKVVTEASGRPNHKIVIPLPNARLWSPTDPFLYNLEVVLLKKETEIDRVSSYFGMRKISIGMVDGVPKMLLNNEFLFQLGALDQGFWPDGLYTAPTDAALKFDIEQQKALGFNMIRKHVKIEPARWYFWADKLGLMVWQDMPSAQSYGGVDADPEIYRHELSRMVETLWNCPSIVMWIIYNEKCGQDAHIKQGLETKELVDLVRSLDSTRLVNQASGYDWYGVGDIADSHTYPAPEANPGSANQAIVSGEFGGIRFPLPGHQWAPPDNVEVSTKEEYLDLYASYATKLCKLKAEKGMSGAVYTQITDVESEQNGILTYDREEMKGDGKLLRALNLRAINQHYQEKEVLSSSQEKPSDWRYTTSDPGADWFKPGFSIEHWQTGEAPFASPATPGIKVGTEWTSGDIWMRKEFEVGRLNSTDIENLFLRIYHDEGCEIYLNGIKIASLTGVSTYTVKPLSEAGKKALKPNATNEIAVHCHQSEGGQGIDVGIETLTFARDKK